MYRVAPGRTTDFHQVVCCEKMQAVADIACGLRESPPELLVAAWDEPSCTSFCGIKPAQHALSQLGPPPASELRRLIPPVSAGKRLIGLRLAREFSGW